jgi:polyketide synthase PksN
MLKEADIHRNLSEIISAYKAGTLDRVDVKRMLQELRDMSAGGNEISKETIQKELATSLAKALYMSPGDIDLHKQFIDMGLDSIVGVEWLQTINKTFDLGLTVTKVYDYPSIKELSGFLHKELKKKGEVRRAAGSSAPRLESAGEPVSQPPFEKVELVMPAGGQKRTNLSRLQDTKPGKLGNPVFQQRYGCKFSYFAGSMYRAISSERFVIEMGQANILSFFGSAGFRAKELEPRIQFIQSQLGANKPYGICLISNINHPEEEMEHAELFVKCGMPVIEAAAFSTLTPAIVYCRVKGLSRRDGRVVFPRRIIAKCSRLEVARLFLSRPPMNIVKDLMSSGLITEEEARLSQSIPMADDLAVEADSGGHTDQGVSFALFPSMMALKESMLREDTYPEDVLVGCGGGIGTPDAVVSAFALGADFVFSGSINQCTVESGAHDVVKDLLSAVSVHDMATAPAGDMFEIGARVQVVKKHTQYATRANRLYRLFQQYQALAEIPMATRQEIEKDYFKRSLSEVWNLVCEYKKTRNPEQLEEALENPRLQMKLIFQWYFAHSNEVTLKGDVTERDNFQIHCGPAMGAFNHWVKGTDLEDWRNRRVAEITELLMNKAGEHLQRRLLPFAANKDKGSSTNKVEQSPVIPAQRQIGGSETAIAIIGMSGQFPQARNLDLFWENLARGQNGVTEIPDNRWPVDRYYDPDKSAPGKTYSKWMGVLDGVDEFDPLFFNISPAEAQWMDPQQRLFLTNAWQCMESAGIDPASLSGSSCGVFVGCGATDYGRFTADGNEHHGLSAQGLMGGSSSILSARISYLLNLKGPCLSIDTACSSSLVAVAEACNSLTLKTSELAFAGGVCILSGPGMHIMTSKASMLSEDGRCYTFDQRANGFVPGEGVGVILLKRLPDAIRDRDPILGVIKGWGINQDGRTNGITAPSVNSQTALEKELYERFGIDPETISLVEAHGTGTKLGDPIEVEALTAAFRHFTDKKEFCAIGSVKSNIGHLLTAAGISGLIKVLLALQHKLLPPTINFEKINEYIPLENGPFYINTELRPWPETHENGRRAAVSSFGFSGTNAHLVVEEYLAEESAAGEAALAGTVIIPLSARNNNRLRECAERLLQFVEKDTGSGSPIGLNLHDLAYTLQVGREAMDERLGIIVHSLRELGEKLRRFIDGRENIDGLYLGQVKRNKDISDAFAADDDMANTIDAWIAKRKYTKLADLWVKGLPLDWNRFYAGSRPRRISLPTYPFARARYWLPEIAVEASGLKPNPAAIHPLMQENTSNFSEQRYSSSFTGREFFLADHVVRGERILPGVAYLEMARAAITQAAGIREEPEEAQAEIQLKNVVWIRPVVAGNEMSRIHIALFPEERSRIAYEIYSESQAEGRPVVHSRGTASLSFSGGSGNAHGVEAPALDLAALRAECNQGSVSSSQCYEVFRSLGIDYGPAHQGVQEIYVGSGQVLAKLVLPPPAADTLDRYVLHPSLMDAALQASVGFVGGMNGGQAALPFALEELDIFGRCSANMWALVRSRDVSTSTGTGVAKVDIDVCDDRGRVCVRLKGLTSRALEKEANLRKNAADPEVLILKPVWKEEPTREATAAFSYARHLVMLCELDGIPRQEIEAWMNGGRCLFLEHQAGEIDKRFNAYAAEAFDEIRGILKDQFEGQALIQIVVPLEADKQLFSALFGLLKTAELESSKIVGQVIEVDNPTGIVRILQDSLNNPTDKRIRYQDGIRRIASWTGFEGDGDVMIPWRERGVYLITGGAGGLGFIFAKEIAERTKDTTVILTGRSSLSPAKERKVKELETLGARIQYKQADVTRKNEVNDLIEGIHSAFGRLDGIIHCAGVNRDNFIIKKSKEELHEVLAPKVNGLTNLDEATRDLPLAFFTLFSSAAGVMGNAGQADYSTANAFMDVYADYRSRLVAAKRRHGQTLSISWPLWKDGGMRVDVETEKMLRQRTGLIPLQTSTGLQSFYRALTSGESQVLVAEGNLSRVKELLSPKSTQSTPAPAPAIPTDTEHLQERVQTALKRSVSKLLKVDMEDIDSDTDLIEYGFDSITLTEFGNALNQQYDLELTPTTFFEHPTIRGCAGYLLKEYRDIFVARFAGSTRPATPVETKKSEAHPAPERPRKRFIRTPSEKPESAASSAIAVVGMSGRFPMAEDLREFWANLLEGKDCIVEVPRERWDWREYYGDPATQGNKTNIKWGGFIADVGAFDPLFFGISPREAERMDPQQRLLMMYVWKAIEDAGYSAESLSGTKTGIFVGTASSGYSELIAQTDAAIEGYSSTGALPSVGPNRMSYFLNLHGPSEPIETACSSSLIAVHRAMESIANGSCEMAIVGGVNTMITPAAHISFSKAGMLSEEGRCRPFSDQANGYVRGEGVGMLFLKKLEDAEAAGDHIYGVIRSSAENHGGRATSLTAPNPKAQAELIRAAYTKAGIDPRTVSYIEAHGTGTALGDPIEISGLKAAFKELYDPAGVAEIVDAHCGLGSVKSNIGHLELAAGIAGVIKVLLQLQHQTLVKTLHCETINPYIDLHASPFYIVREKREWKALPDGQGRLSPRRAGVSSFGFGGANAHVVIEEYVPPTSEREPTEITQQKPAIIVLSAKNEKRLKDHARQLIAAIQAGDISDADLANTAYTLQVGRDGMDERVGLIAASIKEVEDRLQRFVDGEQNVDDLYRGQVKRNKDVLGVFVADEDMARTFEAWIAKEKYTKLLDVWVKGFNLDWNQLYKERKPRRISLPTYPFAKERHWFQEGEQHIKVPPLSTRNTDSFDESFYEQLLDDVMAAKLSVHSAVDKAACVFATSESKRPTV